MSETKITEVKRNEEQAPSFIVQYSFIGCEEPQFLVVSDSDKSALEVWQTQEGCSQDKWIEDHGSYNLWHEDSSTPKFWNSMIFVITYQSFGYEAACNMAYVMTQVNEEARNKIHDLMSEIWM